MEQSGQESGAEGHEGGGAGGGKGADRDVPGGAGQARGCFERELEQTDVEGITEAAGGGEYKAGGREVEELATTEAITKAITKAMGHREQEAVGVRWYKLQQLNPQTEGLTRDHKDEGVCGFGQDELEQSAITKSITEAITKSAIKAMGKLKGERRSWRRILTPIPRARAWHKTSGSVTRGARWLRSRAGAIHPLHGKIVTLCKDNDMIELLVLRGIRPPQQTRGEGGESYPGL